MYQNIWTAPAAPIASPADERAIIGRAQKGDDDATMALFFAYLPALSATVRDFWNAFADEEELRSVVWLGFMEAIHAWDPTGDYDRLGPTARAYTTDAASREAGQHVMSRIPERTLKRFLGILRRADGDPEKGALLAPQFSMAAATFTNIYRQFKATNAPTDRDDRDDAPDIDAEAVSIWGDTDAYADAESRILVATAFAAVNKLEAEVCGLAYGFSDYDPQPDAEIAFRLGLSSRLKALRVRNGALDKMRAALGA